MQTLTEDSKRVYICAGSGGVGKTTTAAALALKLASSGKHVLCLTVDPAKRLANSMGLDSVQTECQEVLLPKGESSTGTLSMMMLDAKATFDAIVVNHASSDQAKERILTNPMYHFLSSSLAGVQEYMAMEKLHEVYFDNRWDVIVLDTPPSSNALDFFAAPQRMVGTIDSPAIRWFVQSITGGRKFSFDLLGKGASLLLKTLSKFTGTGFLEDLAYLIVGLNDLFGGFHERAEKVAEILRGTDVSFVLVTRPTSASFSDAVALSNSLKAQHLNISALVLNVVHPELLDANKQKQEYSKAEIETEVRQYLQNEDANPLVSKMLRAYERSKTQMKQQQKIVMQFEAEFSHVCSRLRIPAFDKDVHDLSSLERVAEFL